MKSGYAVDGAEIPYAIDRIEQIDPGLVGHATLFIREGDLIITGNMDGNIRESLMADYRKRSGRAMPELIMYSGSRVE